MPLHVVLAHDPALLLERAADGFLAAPRGTPERPFPSPGYLLALRQGGLRDDLMRLAARRGCPGWFDPPLCVFAEITRWLGATSRLPLGDAERLVLLTNTLRRLDGDVFSHGRRPEDYVQAIDALVGELCAEGVAPADFAHALEHGAGAHERDDFERRRDAELAALYAAYRSALDAAGRRDGRDGLVDCARAVRESPDLVAERLGGRREVRLVGLQDLRGGWRALLAALAQSPALDRVALYTSAELDLDALGATVDDQRAHGTLAARLFAAAAPSRVALDVDGIAAPDAARELEEVARRVRRLCDGGVPPHRIAVVARESRPHVPLAAAALRRFGVPVTTRQRTALREIPAVRAVLVLLDAAAEGWTRHGLVEVAEHPYLRSALDAGVLNAIGYRRQVRGLSAWRAALADLRDQAERRERGDEAHAPTWERRAALPAASAVARAAEAFEELAARADGLDGERTLAAWVAWLRATVDGDPWAIRARLEQLPAANRYDVLRADLAGWQALGALAGEWGGALERFGGGSDALPPGAFAARLRALCAGDVALWTETQHGVQLFEGPAAAYRAFDHVFVVGLESGQFPQRAPRSPLLGAWERERLVGAGLPLDPVNAWNQRERELFRVLGAGAGTRLTLSWSRCDESGREVVRSAFVDEVETVATLQVHEIAMSTVLTDHMPLCATHDAMAHAARVAGIERLRHGGAVSAWNGAIEDEVLLAELATEFGDARIWSPTQLESYAKCPWSYFAARLLRLETRTEPDDGIEPSLRGTILHRALQRFYDFALRERGGRPVLLHPEEGAKAERDLLRELEVAIAEEEERGSWLGAPALRGALHAELSRILRRYLAFELDHNRKMFGNRGNNPRILRTGVVAHEVRFEDVALDADGVTVRFRGSIDRVEFSVEDRVADAGPYVAAVDYKTSAGAVPGKGEKAAWADGVVLQLPLYARVLAELYPDRDVSRIEYRVLGSGEVKHGLQLYQVDKLPKLVENVPDNEQMVDALAAVGRHVRNARAGRFPAAPAPSCGCPAWCPALDICRVKDGPQLGGW